MQDELECAVVGGFMLTKVQDGTTIAAKLTAWFGDSESAASRPTYRRTPTLTIV